MSIFLKTRNMSLIYVVRAHRKTKNGIKYITPFECFDMKSAKRKCEYLSKYPDVEYTDFITLQVDNEIAKQIICDVPDITSCSDIKIDWDTLNRVYENSDRAVKSYNELIKEEFKK